jgi:hypothetical protein
VFERFGHEYALAFDSNHLRASSVFEAYRLDGLDFLSTLRGGFALCLFDGEKNILILARDKKGVKPLFYKLHKGKIYFSSEIKGIWEAIDECLTVDREMLSLHLSAPSGVYDACDIFRDLCQVMPGECVIFSELGICRFKYGSGRNTAADIEAKSQTAQYHQELILPYPENGHPNIDEVLANALIAFDYPQFDADMPSLCALLGMARSRNKKRILFEDSARKQSFSYAREREDRLGAFYGICAKGRYRQSLPDGRAEEKEVLHKCLRERFFAMNDSQKSFVEKILGTRKLDYLCQRFENGAQKQKDTDAQIRILGMLIQSVMWAESKKLMIVKNQESILSHGFQ